MSDPEAQIREAFRVLKPNSRACFTVWGRREMSVNFTVRMIARKNLGLENLPSASNFDAGENIDQTRQLFLNAGFANVRVWNQPSNFPYFTGEDYVNTFFSGFDQDETKWTDADRQLRAEMIKVYDEMNG